MKEPTLIINLPDGSSGWGDAKQYIQVWYQGGGVFNFNCTTECYDEDDEVYCGICGGPETAYYSFEQSRDEVKQLIKQLTALLELPVEEPSNTAEAV